MARKLTQADFVKTALRLPPELHARVHESAEANGRTYNAELIARLEQSFIPPPSVGTSDDDLIKKFHALVNPALVEMARIENETRKELALKGVPQADIDAAMAVKVDPAELQKKRAGKGSKKP
ncbi:Arc family DNA-binding protein [Stenotrophomonas sp. AS1]|uniref:Arc family DNA-binding protein n=1 Tax=Stenotrophomonas sp. AS1 TaxID=3029188 RepID=UPI003B78EE3D